MSGSEPTTGWEAQAWDPPADPVGAEQERTDRPTRLTPSDDDPTSEQPSDKGLVDHPADQTVADPVVPDEVETTVPIGATGSTEVAGGPADEPAVDVAAHTAASLDAWRDLQVQFVDDPAGAVEGAASLVRQAVETHTGAGGSTDTEQLRRAFTRLRDLHARLTR